MTRGPARLPGLVAVIAVAAALLVSPRLADSESPEVGRNEVWEATFNLPSSGYSNPWEDVDLALTLTSPSGARVLLGGFYYAANTWKARLAPWEIGRWVWTAVATDRTQVIFKSSGDFTVVESPNPGFVRRSPSNPLRLVYENGTPFSAIGIGDCVPSDPASPQAGWGLDGTEGTASHTSRGRGRLVNTDTYLSAYGQAGFNLFRWSVDNCAAPLWDRIAPQGNRYLEREGRWGDDLARKLHRHGFRIYLTFFNSPPFAHDVGDTPGVEAVVRYARYIVNRYGAFVDFWELMNESEATDSWYAIVAGAVRAADPYHHLLSTSWERPQLAAIDITSPHWYEREDERDSDVAAVHRIDRWRAFNKPIIFGEQGNEGQNWDERSALRMRLRSWTAFFKEATLIFWNTSGFKDYRASAANLYLGPQERGYVRSLQAFARTVPADAHRAPILTSEPQRVRAYALRSEKVLAAYMHHFADHERPIAGASIRIDSPVEGQAVWYDPATGSVVQTAHANAGVQTLQVPPFVVDIALKIGPPGP